MYLHRLAFFVQVQPNVDFYHFQQDEIQSSAWLN